VAVGTSPDNPTLNKRSFQTNVIVEDGSFVVISGLIQDQADQTVSKVPLLGDLPLIGRLFRYDTRDHTKTQTMVFLRPTIIRDESAAGDIALNRYDYIRTQVAQTRQGHLAPLPDLSLEDLPPAPAPARPNSTPATPPAPPGTESLPVVPQPAPQPAPPAASPQSRGDPVDAVKAQAPARPDAPVAAAAPTVLALAPAAATVQTLVARPALASSLKAAPYQLIQVSAVHDIGRGRQLQQRLRSVGFDSYWESVRTVEGDVVRIRISVERRASKIADALSVLRRLGYDPVLVGQ
jgi:hypothetical protein